MKKWQIVAILTIVACSGNHYKAVTLSKTNTEDLLLPDPKGQQQLERVVDFVDPTKNPAEFGWRVIHAGGPGKFTDKISGTELPLALEKADGQSFYRIKSEGTDNIHFNLLKRNFRLTDKSVLDLDLLVDDDSSPDANLGDDDYDDGVFQLLLVLGNYDDTAKMAHITHILQLTYKTKASNDPGLNADHLGVSSPQVAAAAPSNPSGTMDSMSKSLRRQYGDKVRLSDADLAALDSSTDYNVASTNVKFFEIYGQLDRWLHYRIDLKKLVERAYDAQTAAQLTYVIAVGIESTTTSWNCSGQKGATADLKSSCRLKRLRFSESK